MILRNSVGDDRGVGVPTQRVGASRIVVIRAQKPRNETLSCVGQILNTFPHTHRNGAQRHCAK